MKAQFFLFVLASVAFYVNSAPASGCVTSNGLQVAEGAIYKPTACEFCTCNNGRLMCAIQDCAFPHCDTYITPPGHCCPVCQSGFGPEIAV
ncbi:cysteine-rich motor neuron 1 protein [Biomphalaria pfeifferi]|uniref:Cysteine-rich motor neuron 1 protein n=1 Tax=Biomphalaria pfeifferi TaxID=112525 RepID=A0AAD8C9N7_BIOPF|nr:cysteine-rich motor neuron 1 protein [Biomphalaria pfeifferi]